MIIDFLSCIFIPWPVFYQLEYSTIHFVLCFVSMGNLGTKYQKCNIYWIVVETKQGVDQNSCGQRKGAFDSFFYFLQISDC